MQPTLTEWKFGESVDCNLTITFEHDNFMRGNLTIRLHEFFTTPGLSKRISTLRKKIFPLITDPHIRAIALRSLLNYGWYLVSNDLYIGLHNVNRQVLINQLKALGRDYAKECGS